MVSWVFFWVYDHAYPCILILMHVCTIIGDQISSSSWGYTDTWYTPYPPPILFCSVLFSFQWIQQHYCLSCLSDSGCNQLVSFFWFWFQSDAFLGGKMIYEWDPPPPGLRVTVLVSVTLLSVTQTQKLKHSFVRSFVGSRVEQESSLFSVSSVCETQVSPRFSVCCCWETVFVFFLILFFSSKN